MLSGLLGAAGEDMMSGEKRRYDEAVKTREQRLGILRAAAQAPNANIPAIMEEMDRVASEPLMPSGRGGRGKKAKKPGYFATMGQLLGPIAGQMGGGAVPGQTPPFQGQMPEPSKSAEAGFPEPASARPAVPPVPGAPPGAAAYGMTAPSPAGGRYAGLFRPQAEMEAEKRRASEVEAEIGAKWVGAETRAREEATAPYKEREAQRDQDFKIAQILEQAKRRGHQLKVMQGTTPGSVFEGQVDLTGTPVNTKLQYKTAMDAENNIIPVAQATPTAAQAAERWEFIRDPDSPTGYTHVKFAEGKPVTFNRGVLPPSGYVPTITQTTRVVPTAEGIVLVPVTSTRTKGMPGEITPPLPTRESGKQTRRTKEGFEIIAEQPPPEGAKTAWRELQNARTLATKIKSAIDPQLTIAPTGTIGELLQSVQGLAAKGRYKLGGAGLAQWQKDLLANIDRFSAVAGAAIQRGGPRAQLWMSLVQQHLPKAYDSWQQMAIKMRNAMEGLDKMQEELLTTEPGLRTLSGEQPQGGQPQRRDQVSEVPGSEAAQADEWLRKHKPKTR
jgi:hypothetical protein